MKANWKNYLIGALVIVLIIQFIINKINAEDVTQLKIHQKEEQKVKEQEVRDDSLNEIQDITEDTKKKIDDILIENATIKHRPYEKRIYLNRSIDSAIIILSNARRSLQQQNR